MLCCFSFKLNKDSFIRSISSNIMYANFFLKIGKVMNLGMKGHTVYLTHLAPLGRSVCNANHPLATLNHLVTGDCWKISSKNNRKNKTPVE